MDKSTKTLTQNKVVYKKSDHKMTFDQIYPKALDVGKTDLDAFISNQKKGGLLQLFNSINESSDTSVIIY